MDYQDILYAYETEILRLGALRNVQAEGDRNWLYYQDRITEETERMQAFDDAIPALENADAEARQATIRYGMTQNDAEAEIASWGRAAKIAGFVGLACLIVTLLGVGGPWPTIGTVLSLAAAVGAVLYGGKVRRVRQIQVDDDKAQRDAAKARREALWASVQRRAGGTVRLPEPANDSPLHDEAEVLADVD